MIQAAQKALTDFVMERKRGPMVAIDQQYPSDQTERHRSFMTGLHAGDDLFAYVVLPNCVHLPGVFHILSRRVTIDFKPYRDARLLLMAEPAAPSC